MARELRTDGDGGGRWAWAPLETKLLREGDSFAYMRHEGMRGDTMKQKCPFSSKDCWELFQGTGCAEDEGLAADADLEGWVTVLPGKDIPSAHK